MPTSFDTPTRGKLRPYRCTGTIARTGHPCRTTLIEAWAPFGAIVRRRCKQCGSWSEIVVRADPPEPPDASPVLD